MRRPQIPTRSVPARAWRAPLARERVHEARTARTTALAAVAALQRVRQPEVLRELAAYATTLANEQEAPHEQ
ncbi:hypothetical protein [Haloechinothrix salitolerans]|uniref:Uncharacterized protein n=1 Tax=Haloechinothrix salitolerans TaxID=926830 RepID=A0ABW2C5K8_9PSEU